MGLQWVKGVRMRLNYAFILLYLLKSILFSDKCHHLSNFHFLPVIVFQIIFLDPL
jgi:hypothetical protein